MKDGLLQLKGMFTDFNLLVHGTVSSLGILFISSLFNFFDPCGQKDRFYGVTGWSNRHVAVTC